MKKSRAMSTPPAMMRPLVSSSDASDAGWSSLVDEREGRRRQQQQRGKEAEGEEGTAAAGAVGEGRLRLEGASKVKEKNAGLTTSL